MGEYEIVRGQQMYIIQILKHDTDFFWQIYGVTDNEDSAVAISSMLEDHPDVKQAGYEKHDLITMEDII